MISIIVPLHNLGSKGDYCLKRCLDSILAQTYNDYEVLLMENGSSDDTVEVAKTYCQKDNRFKLHILETIGIANARNEGLKIAAGEYVSFIDGDDTISGNFLDVCVNILYGNSDIDFVSTSWLFYYSNGKSDKPVTLFENTTICKNTLKIDYPVASTVWSKVIKKSVLLDNQLFFNLDLFGNDDVLFGNKLQLISKYYAVTGDCVYYYTQNRKNQTTSTRLQSIAESTLRLYNNLIELYTLYNCYHINKNITDTIFISLFIGPDFAMTPLRKMKRTSVVNIIKSQKNNILSFDIVNSTILKWQKVWFRRFQNAVAFWGGVGGYLFIKFMRFYRNIILQPLGIKIHKLY